MEKKLDITPVLNILGRIASKALQGATEALLDEAQDKAEILTNKISEARNKSKKSDSRIHVTVEEVKKK